MQTNYNKNNIHGVILIEKDKATLTEMIRDFITRYIFLQDLNTEDKISIF